MREKVVAFAYDLLLLFLLNSEMAFGGERTVVASVALFFDLELGASHYLSNTVDNAFVLSLHVISLKISQSGGLVGWGVRNGGSLGFDRWLRCTKIGVVASFVLKVEKLLTFFDVHLIILCKGLFTHFKSAWLLKWCLDFYKGFKNKSAC